MLQNRRADLLSLDAKALTANLKKPCTSTGVETLEKLYSFDIKGRAETVVLTHPKEPRRYRVLWLFSLFDVNWDKENPIVSTAGLNCM